MLYVPGLVCWGVTRAWEQTCMSLDSSQIKGRQFLSFELVTPYITELLE